MGVKDSTFVHESSSINRVPELISKIHFGNVIQNASPVTSDNTIKNKERKLKYITDFCKDIFIVLVGREGLEPSTSESVALRSIQLS